MGRDVTAKRGRKVSSWNEIDGGEALVIPLSVLRHANFKLISAYALKLVLDLGSQYTGHNNGYLCASWALMIKAGWRSPRTLQKAMLEAEHFNLIQRTRQGGKNRCNLHALTWRRINEKPGRDLDCFPTMKPSNAWKEPKTAFVYEQRPQRSRRRKNTAPNSCGEQRSLPSATSQDGIDSSGLEDANSLLPFDTSQGPNERGVDSSGEHLRSIAIHLGD